MGRPRERLLQEALDSVRTKDVRSTTLERLRLTWEADRRIQGLPQPLQLGEGLSYLLERIATPVAPHDLLLGRIAETVPNPEEEAFFRGDGERLERARHPALDAGWRTRVPGLG